MTAEGAGLKVDYYREREALGTVGALALIDGPGECRSSS